MYRKFGGEDEILSQEELIDKLKKEANSIRRDLLTMISNAEKGHPGGSLSATDIVTALYFTVMNIDPDRPEWEKRDRFILSKGHACPVWYTALARRGYFAKEHLSTLRKNNSMLQGHPDMKKTPGIDMTAGSLGNGLSIGLGMALAAKKKNLDYKVYVMLGDGEIEEGMVWEAAMAAGNLKPSNLLAIVDYNGIQNDDQVKNIMGLEPLIDKWKAFGWKVKEIEGNRMEEVIDGFTWWKKVGGPAVIIAHTVKGKGVSFMENSVEWHGGSISEKQLEKALSELERTEVNG
ncbi:MAG: transketolase [Halanaerobiaceae bacterium]